VRDIQFISMVDKLLVTSIEDIDGASPRTLRVYGKRGFKSAQRVEINDYGVDSFTVVSDMQLLVVPGSLFDDVETSRMSAVVHSSKLTSTDSMTLTLAPTKHTKSVSGVQKLVQQVVKVLLTNLGSNRFAPDEGGDLLRLVGESFSEDAMSQISAAVSQSITLTSRYILAEQAKRGKAAASERLMALTLEGVTYDSAVGEVAAKIRLTTMTGSTVDIPLAL